MKAIKERPSFQILALAIRSFVNLGKLLTLLSLGFFNCAMGHNISLSGFLWIKLSNTRKAVDL